METVDYRRWQRLPLAIPVFAQGIDENGKKFSEFTSLLNIGGGGALLAMRRSSPRSSRMVLEIPSPPMPGLAMMETKFQKINSRVVHVTHSHQYDLLGMQFTRPLLKPILASKKDRQIN